MNNGFLIFKKEAEIIQAEYPDLVLEVTEESPKITGIIYLNDKNGSFIDHYNIMIVPTQEYPSRFPYVFETGGRIPNNVDWHVYPDRHFCISTIPEEILICKNGISLFDFIETQLEPYLFNQKHRELHGYFLKERPHGDEGNLQFFKEAFRTKDLSFIIQGLRFIKQRKEPNRVCTCFCGSNLKYRKCHRETYRKLSAFTDEQIDYFINIIIKFLIKVD